MRFWIFDETEEVLCKSTTLAETLNFDEKDDVEKREELLSCPPRCPRNRRSISTVFNASEPTKKAVLKFSPCYA